MFFSSTNVNYFTVFLSFLTRERDRTVNVPWPFSTIRSKALLRSDSIVPRCSWPFTVPGRSPFLTVQRSDRSTFLSVPERSPFLSVPERSPFLSVFDRFITVPDRSWPFLTVPDRFMSFSLPLRSFSNIINDKKDYKRKKTSWNDRKRS